MRPFLLAVACLVLSSAALAQAAADEPASKDDIELYLRTMHSHDMMQKMMDAELKPMREMFRDQLGKDSPRPSAESEKHFNQMMDDLFKNMPLDEMTQALVPVYQKHFTKGDVGNLIAFYSSPTGQKLLEEMPAITGESMQVMMPIMLKYIDQSKQRMQQEMKKIDKTSPPSSIQE